MKQFVYMIGLCICLLTIGCEEMLEMEPKNSLTYGSNVTEKELEASFQGGLSQVRTYMMLFYNNSSNYVVVP